MEDKDRIDKLLRTIRVYEDRIARYKYKLKNISCLSETTISNYIKYNKNCLDKIAKAKCKLNQERQK